MFPQAISIIVPLLMVGSLLLLYGKGTPEYHASISRSVAEQRSARFISIALLSIIGPLYYWFVFGWLAQKYDMPETVIIIGIIGFIGQTVALWVPAVVGWRMRVHLIGALAIGVAIVMVAFALMFANTSQLVHVSSIAFLILTACIAGVVTAVRFKKYAMIAEVVFGATFYSLIILATYL